MWRLHILLLLCMSALLRSLRLHIGLINEKGTPDSDTAYNVDELEYSHAVYARMESGREVDYYSFEAEAGFVPRLMLFVTTSAYNKRGFRVSMTLTGPGIPPEGLIPPAFAQPFNIMGADYMLLQSHYAPVPQSGQYKVRVDRITGEGVYAFCVGSGEGKVSEPEMLQRIMELLVSDN
ncbi:MAG: hypothetical protein HXX08_18560 [Chloroflexi bacterium]|uniref:Uncharacterized protein n=1 Tax=Candidatus Chlorohelix allophototropha TaxID=3003348 RepID=A0A8T7M6T5_9CHLR|nr:hypothetical protein [Chloroflexota bacterium]WJW69764.1 hypothetical protein OZ401_003394 [Chloroflexota bacterium L227-S17]